MGNASPEVENMERRRSTRFSRPLVVALIVIALLGVSFLKQLSLLSDPGTLVISTYLWLPSVGLLAGLVLAFAAGQPLGPAPWPVFSSVGRLSAMSLAVAVASLVCAVYSAILESGDGSPSTITAAWITGMLLVLAAAGGPEARNRIGGYRFRFDAWLAEGWKSVFLPASTLLVILVVATLLRATALNTIPGFVHFDEAGSGIQARQIASGQVAALFSYGYGTIPVLGYAWDALFLRIFGDTLAALRLSSVVPGVLSVLFTALLGKELFNVRTGLLAAALLALSHYYIQYSRVALTDMHAAVLCLLTLYLLVRALRYDSRLSAAGVGVVISLDLQVYFAARVIIVLVPVIVGYVLLISDRQLLKQRFPILGWLLFATLVSILPPAVWFSRDWSQYSERIREVLVIGGNATTQRVVHYQIFGTSDPVYILRTNLWRAIQTFNDLGDTSDHYSSGYPLLDPMSAALLPTAVVYACCRVFRTGFAVCAIIFFAVLISGGMLTIDQPDWDRLILMGPTTALLIAAMLDGLWQLLDRLPRLSFISLLAASALVGAIAYGNYNYYFNVFQPQERGSAQAITLDVGNFLHSIHHPFYAYSVTNLFYMNWEVLQYLAPNTPECSVPTDADLRLCPPVATHDRIFFIDSRRTTLLPTIEREFPGGRFSLFHTYASVGNMYIYRVRS